MIEFRIKSAVTVADLLHAAKQLTAMAQGLQGGLQVEEAPKQVETATVDVPDSTDTTQLNTTTTATNQTTVAGAGSLDTSELDSEGAPYDPDIHASTKTKTAKGIWKKARGLDEAIYKAKNAENIAAAKAALGSEDPEEAFYNDSAEVEDPEEVFGSKERPDFMDDEPAVLNKPVPTEEAEEAAPATSDLPSTPKELMDRSISHLSQGNLSLDEITGVLKQNPNAAGEVAPHLGALAAGDKFAGQVPAIAQAMNNVLAMKGMAL